MTARFAKPLFALAVFVVLTVAITSRVTKWLSDFDQSFYLTIAYDLDHHGVFSNGIFDETDSTSARPAPGMFFGPLYPALLLAVAKVDPRFARAVDCSVESNHKKRDPATCEVYATSMHVAHALLLTIGVVAIALAAQVLFGPPTAFYLAGILAILGLLPEADLFSYLMTESLTFCLYGVAALFMLLAWTTGRRRHAALSGLFLGLLTLARPSFLVLAPALLLLIVAAGWPVPARRQRLWGQLLAFAAAFLLVVGPWVARNSASVGKLGLTEEYGAAALIERFAFNDMTAGEFMLAFPYCVPGIGPALVGRLAGPEATARYEWNRPGSFFEAGRARRMALVERHGRLDPVFRDLFWAEMRQHGWQHVLSSVALAWCGLWVGQIAGLLLIPLFVWAGAAAWRGGKPLFLLYAVPPLIMVGLHGAVANHYSRYNLILIGPAAAGGAWLLARLLAARRERVPAG
jgi:hypothetical protein